MACVILPSETARLVYGYLVKENLSEIAHRFLESSPYLTDCCQIVKSGYQFNTKLMNKDLQELLQEYSVIHNLVNNKVSLLQKTSLLYKRIKLRCESLPEILELILFRKYKNLKTDENSQNNGNPDKNTSKETISNISGYANNGFENDNSNTKVENSKTQESICENESTNPSNINSVNNSDNKLSRKNENGLPDNFTSDAYEADISMKEVEQEENISEVHENIISHEGNEQRELLPAENSKKEEKNENINSIDISSSVNQNSNVNSKLLETHSSSVNILTIDLNASEEHIVTDQIPPGSTQINEVNNYESQTKIVGIEERNHHQSHTLDLYSKPSGGGNGNINFESTSVVFMDPVGEVGNVAIDQKRQLIFIPIDCQDEIQNRMELISSENQNQNRGNEFQNKEEIIFEGISSANPASKKSCGLFDNQISGVDGNIMTEEDFLNNKQFVFDLEKESRTALQPQPLKSSEETNEAVPVQAVSAPLIVVGQNQNFTVVPNKTPRYRAILPKKEEPKPIFPVVVVQPFLETSSDSSKSSALKSRTFKIDSKETENCLTENVKSKLNKFEAKEEREVKNGRKKTFISQKTKSKEGEKKDGLRELGSLPEKSKASSKESPKDLVRVTETTGKVVETNEEKENVEKKEQKFENKKIETPVFVTKRNSKRLSLSTPRRRSHIRALEFETPPKTSEDRKKSKTSPKIKVEKVNVERKSVRNTLFKSPIPENSPVVSKENKKTSPLVDTKTDKLAEPLSELSIPIATSSPNTKLSDAWENLTGVGCMLGQVEPPQKERPKKMWDADLRHFISENNQNAGVQEKKRIRKPERCQKNNRKATKKKVGSAKKCKPSPVAVPSSKISLTAKRNTYSINGNEEGSPIRSLLEDLKIVTPFKDIDTIRPTEETPLTKLLRENINNIDIDLSMINTPSFPPTPSIIITPDLDDISMVGANYYSPSKDKVLKITDHFKGDTEKINKKESKEMHEKVVGDLVSKAKEIIGLGKENQEENPLRRRPSGKMLSMVKIQMLSQCDKKLCENIPINEENNFSNSFMNNSSLNLSEGNQDIKDELEEKKKRTLEKIKENSTQARTKVNKRGRKRRRSNNNTKSDKSKSDVSSEITDSGKGCESEKMFQKEGRIFHSTPYTERKLENSDKTESENKINSKLLEDIRQEFPPFENSTDKYPELTEKSRKKLHYVENFLKLNEIRQFLNDYDKDNPPKLFLKCSLRRFFQVFYKWLKHPHKRELDASQETKAKLREYLSIFEKVNRGLNQRNKRFKKDSKAQAGSSSSDFSHNNSGNKDVLSDDEEKDWKKRDVEKRKDEESEDGIVSTLPLKKRKSTVQQVEIKPSITSDKDDSKNTSADVSQTQHFLQDIDVDRFLSQIHGQENR